MSLASGTRLGPYEIQAAIGAGGMGEVYKARDTRLNRTVAIKVLPAAVAGDPERRARFEREAKTIAALNHPHICSVYDVGRQGDTDFLVMEYVDGETLAARVRRSPLGISEIERLGVQLSEGLGAAHQHGLVHRDIKPANLMLSLDGVLKILDFGIAKPQEPLREDETTRLVGEPWARTAPGVLVGTPSYMAPEQITGGPAAPPSDV
ncbi:MAG: serine/threonine-protein kinase, partial [Bacteroidales bacterium]